MQTILSRLNISVVNHGTSTGLNSWASDTPELIESFSPVDGKVIAKVTETTLDDYQKVIETAKTAFKSWKNVPAPRRGEIVRQMGEAFRQNKEALGQLVSYEMGKSLQEGLAKCKKLSTSATLPSDFLVNSTDSRCTPNAPNTECMNNIMPWELWG
jgi:aldehyde dehydrogenase (NAD+)